MNVRILLGDDHAVVRLGLRDLLQTETGIRVVGEAEDGLQLVQLAVQLRPDVMVVDLMMPGLNGLEVMRKVSRHCPRIRMIVLSMHRNEQYVMEALSAGATGYVLKDSAPSEIVQAIHQALQDNRYLSPRLTGHVADALYRDQHGTQSDSYKLLTDRERDVLLMSSEGKTMPEIGNLLSISSRTAQTHRDHAMDKLGLRNQTELVMYAIQRGILPIQG